MLLLLLRGDRPIKASGRADDPRGAQHTHLLQAAVEPHEAAAVRDVRAVHLDLDLVEATVALHVDLLLEVYAVRAVHLVQHLVDGCLHHRRVARVVQVRGALTAAAVDTFDEARLIRLHGQDGGRVLRDHLLAGSRVGEVSRGPLLGQHAERRRRRADVLADLLEPDLLELAGGDRFRAGPHQLERVDGHGGLGGLGEGGPARHEDDLASVALLVQDMILGAHEVEALLEVLHVSCSVVNQSTRSQFGMDYEPWLGWCMTISHPRTLSG